MPFLKHAFYMHFPLNGLSIIQCVIVVLVILFYFPISWHTVLVKCCLSYEAVLSLYLILAVPFKDIRESVTIEILSNVFFVYPFVSC